MEKFKNNILELIAEYESVSQGLLTKCFGEHYSYRLEKLSDYNNTEEGVHYWTVSFDSLYGSISSLKSECESKWGGIFEYDFSQIEFTLDKIKELRKQDSDIQKKELYIYIDYFVSKTTKLLFAMEKESIIF